LRLCSGLKNKLKYVVRMEKERVNEW